MATATHQERTPLVSVTPQGLYCQAGNFHIDPWRPVERALVTHAHGDHARSGSKRYLGAAPGRGLLQRRLGADAVIDTLEYGEKLTVGDTTVSFHPAGHVLGSAQIRVEHRGEVWVISGDYKRTPDPTCAPFEVVRCNTFITEATFGLPIYRWDETDLVAQDILRWWDANREAGRSAVLFCYALGKAQRLLAELGKLTDRPAYVHGAVNGLVTAYREAGIAMLPTQMVSETEKGTSFAGALVLAPPSAAGSMWMRRFGEAETGFASGWMRVRGNRRRRGYDRGFVLSDHADWPDLLRTVADTQAEKVLVTHGYTDPLSHYLRERGVDASPLATPFEGEAED
ncbi:ligase-associated DNA damage response exonuclease [Corallococcus exiguus]|uniref:ligase-associated DNA damage response exonuclease n=1 Tax=Corallococcus TaxID=83461 RepID=UPI000EC2A3EC|nr:ligase-associated DNA damage response exonuclease [Corallococcus sp. AB032C]NNB95470.1 ligase-associated DNA damage response exonuclease [Corallococcus exiguus]NPC51059.1 ligase-associated DNA damage response exonuclease [Corallococcus exiguus]RKH76484.1 ligase-associated DNA damage response exonuclease [Corallococcus sp. AB032C]